MDARSELKHLDKNQNSLLAIHYSCQNLNDSNEGYSPRITSIAVFHVGSHTMHSFSIHLIAEVKKIARGDIHNHYNDLEAVMLEDFYKFVQEHQDHSWLHWNMTNINFGFETLEHRYRVLTDKIPPKIADTKKHNLSSLVSEIYGSNYVDHPKMPNLMDLNGGKSRDFLTGAEEVQAFERKEYIKLHKSTMSKVYFFNSVFHKLVRRKLRTARSNWKERINRGLESTPVKIISFVAVLFAIFQLYQTVENSFFTNEAVTAPAATTKGEQVIQADAASRRGLIPALAPIGHAVVAQECSLVWHHRCHRSYGNSAVRIDGCGGSYQHVAFSALDQLALMLHGEGIPPLLFLRAGNYNKSGQCNAACDQATDNQLFFVHIVLRGWR